MANARRTPAGPAPMRPVVLVAAVVLGASFIGFAHVSVKNLIFSDGEKTKALEKELADIRDESQMLKTKIEELTALPVLERKLADGTIALKPIDGSQIVRLPYVAPGGAGEIRAVSNREAGR